MSVNGTSASRGAEQVCQLQTCSKFSVQKYLNELRQFLPYVPPIPVKTLKSLRDAGDFKGMVRLIKRTMNVEVDLRIVWVSQSDENAGPFGNAPAWIDLPREMPAYGSEAFRELRLDVYFRRSFLEESTYDQVAIAISHELSHVILESIKHPLRGCEKAVDLTAMLLGFCSLYASGIYREKQEHDWIIPHKLGYLSVEEVLLAHQLLSGRKARRPSSVRQLDSLQKAVVTAVAFLLILALGAVLPLLAGRQSSPMRPAGAAYAPSNPFTPSAPRFAPPNSTASDQTYVRRPVKHTFANPPSTENSGSDPTRCCGLW